METSTTLNARKTVTRFGADELVVSPYVCTYDCSRDGEIDLWSAEVVDDREYLRIHGFPVACFVPGMTQAEYDAVDIRAEGGEWAFCVKHNAFPIPRKPIHVDDLDALTCKDTCERLVEAIAQHEQEERWAARAERGWR